MILTETPDFCRVRVESRRYSLSVTADVAFDSYIKVEPEDVAARSTCDLFHVSSAAAVLRGNIVPTFVVTVTGDPKDPELTLRTIAARIEKAYDDLSGAELVR